MMNNVMHTHVKQHSFFDILGPGAVLDVREPDYTGLQTIEQRFDAFHVANPHVYNNLKTLALTLRRRGFRHYGMKALFEVLRFNRALATSGEPYKLNNNYTALYARRLMAEVPELRGFFETRERTSD